MNFNFKNTNFQFKKVYQFRMDMTDSQQIKTNCESSLHWPIWVLFYALLVQWSLLQTFSSAQSVIVNSNTLFLHI